MKDEMCGDEDQGICLSQARDEAHSPVRAEYYAFCLTERASGSRALRCGASGGIASHLVGLGAVSCCCMATSSKQHISPL